MTELLSSQEVFVPFETLVLPPQPEYVVPECGDPGFYYANAEMKTWFGGKSEEATDESEIIFMRYSGQRFACENEVSEYLSDAPPLRMLQIFTLLWRHLVRLPSPALLTGWPNVFHALDRHNVRRTVQARWFPSHCGWELRAHESAGHDPIYRHAHIALPYVKGPLGGPLLKLAVN